MIFSKFNGYPEPKYSQNDVKELLHENEMLKNRCLALTHGEMCLFCPYDCNNRTTKFRGNK